MTSQIKDTRAGRLGPQARPGRSALQALRILHLCPLLPVDAFRHIAGFGSIGGAYRRLENLRRAGLADMQRAELGYLLADRPLGLWSITERGQRVLGELSRLDPSLRGRRNPPHGLPNVTSRVAAYRLLAFLVAECNADGQMVDLCAFEHPWVRTIRGPHQGEPLRVRLPAGAVLATRIPGTERAGSGAEKTSLGLVPDLGAAPVARYREMLRRVLAFREYSGDADFQLVVVTIDPDGDGGRSSVWMSLMDRLAQTHGTQVISSRVVGWGAVGGVLSGSDPGDRGEDWRTHHGAGVLGPSRRRCGPGRTRDQLLHLIGRHPFLAAAQLADLLSTSVRRIRRLESDLVRSGWLSKSRWKSFRPWRWAGVSACSRIWGWWRSRSQGSAELLRRSAWIQKRQRGTTD